MKSTARKLLTLTLVASYGAIALVGQGLHCLEPHAGHHNGLEVVSCSIHGDAHWHHQHDAECGHEHGPVEPADAEHGGGLVLTSSGCAAESHVCEICAFLYQLRSERAALAATVDWQPVVAEATVPPQRSYTPTSVGSHAPRGPPSVSA